MEVIKQNLIKFSAQINSEIFSKLKEENFWPFKIVTNNNIANVKIEELEFYFNDKKLGLVQVLVANFKGMNINPCGEIPLPSLDIEETLEFCLRIRVYSKEPPTSLKIPTPLIVSIEYENLTVYEINKLIQEKTFIKELSAVFEY